MNNQHNEEQQLADVLARSQETARVEEENRADIAAAIAASIATSNAANTKRQKQVCEATWALRTSIEASHRAAAVLRLYEKCARNTPQKINDDAQRAAGEQNKMFQNLRSLTSNSQAMVALNALSMKVTRQMVLKWESESKTSLQWHLKSEAATARVPAPSVVSNYRQHADEDRKIAEELASKFADEDRKIAADAAVARKFSAAPPSRATTEPLSSVSNYRQHADEAAAAAVYTINSINCVSISGGIVTTTRGSCTITYGVHDMGSKHENHNNLCGYLSLANGNGAEAIKIKERISSLADSIANKPSGHFAKLGEMMTEEVIRAYVAIYKTNVCVVNTAGGVLAETYIMSDSSSGPMIYIINRNNVHFQRLEKNNTA
jgi:hypothetical protein